MLERFAVQHGLTIENGEIRVAKGKFVQRELDGEQRLVFADSQSEHTFDPFEQHPGAVLARRSFIGPRCGLHL
jgi:hypothetical protein